MRRFVLSLFALLSLCPDSSAVEVERVLRVYDLVDLLDKPRDLPAPILGVATTVVPNAPASVTLRTSDPISPEVFLRATFEPGLASLITENSEWRSGHLLALNSTAELHRQVERTLAAARTQTQLQVRLNIKLVLMDPYVRLARFPLVRLDWKPLPDQPGLLYADLTPGDLDYVTTNLRLNSRPSKELETTHYPLVTLFAGQLGHVATVTTQAHRPMSLLQGSSVASLTLGDTVTVRATPTPDRNYLTVEVDHRRCALSDKRVLDFGTQGAADLPILWHGGEMIRRSIPVGHGLIIATGAYLDGKLPRSGFLIIRPELRVPGTVAPQVTLQAP